MGLRSEVEVCPSCSKSHLDWGEWVKSHKEHLCSFCGKLFRSIDPVSGRVVGNPLADICNSIVRQKSMQLADQGEE